MMERQKKNHHSNLQIGTVHTIGNGVIRFDMNENLHLPPPAFGTFISVSSGQRVIYGVIYNATIKSVFFHSNSVHSSQIPDAEYIRENNHSIRLQIELQAVLIGNLDQKTHRLQDCYYPNLLYRKPIYIPNQNELTMFSEDLDYMKLFFPDNHLIPGEELCIALLRRFIVFFGNRPDYETIMEKKIQRLFADQPERASSILKRMGFTKWR